MYDVHCTHVHSTHVHSTHVHSTHVHSTHAAIRQTDRHTYIHTSIHPYIYTSIRTTAFFSIMQRSGVMCMGVMRKSKFGRRMNRNLPLSSKRGNKHYNKGKNVKAEGRITVRRGAWETFSSFLLSRLLGLCFLFFIFRFFEYILFVCLCGVTKR